MGPLGPNGIKGGSVRFNPDGSTHTTVYGGQPGGDGRFSWNTGPGGHISGHHFTDGGVPKGDPGRHPFG